MGTLHLSCIQIAIALLLLTQAKSTTKEISVHLNNTTTRCIADERSALVTFRAGLSYPANRLSSWKGDDCCRWKGVNCSNKTGHVVRLDLRGPDCDNSDSSSLHGLRYIDLSLSSFVGRIPPQLGNLSNLRYFSLDSNFGDTYSRDLTWLSRLATLEHLDMTFVNLSTITDWLPVVNMLPSLKVLRLPFCQLRSCPDSLQVPNLTSLEVLDLLANDFHKRSSPNWFWDLTSLKYLDISSNGFFGPFPDKIGNMTSMVKLDISNTDLVGMVPSNMKNLCNLEELFFFGSNINGSITEFFERLPNCSWNKLQTLFLPFCNLTGSLPATLLPLSNLSWLVLSSNQLTGPMPLWIGDLTKLTMLEMGSNNLDGAIHEGMILMRDVDDEFPDAFRYGVSFDHNELVDYSENFTVLTKGQERLYTGEVIYMVNLDLSCNNLIGEIPEEIATLVALKSLNLSWNMLSEKIPEKIGALVQVESLDLSHNELSGEIPTSLSALTSLSRLNMSYNNLTGPVPSGNQLQTLEDPLYIYIGNPGLCGPPLPRNCSQLEPIPATQELHEDARDVVSFFIAMGVGYAIAIWFVFFTFLFKRKWRVSWFTYCDSMYDRVYVLVAVTWASLTRRNV
ncbi:unnamed protein product [Alopecurus aequalis]